MSEIERQFREELQELLDRYKDQLTNPQIMRIAQPIFTKTIGFKDNPERFRGVGYAKGFPIIDELEGSLGRDAVAGITNNTCSAQEIAEADCDGDIRHCNRACYKGEFKCID